MPLKHRETIMTDHFPPEAANSAKTEFARQAEQASPGIVREFLQFLAENKKWWLIPIFVAVGLIAALVVLTNNPATAPFIYTVF